MAKIIHSLITKLTVAFLVLVIVITAMTFVYTYNETKAALKNEMSSQLLDTSQAIATQINATILASLAPGDENTTGFIEVRDQIRTMRMSTATIAYSYIMYVEEGEVFFLVDDTYGYDADAPAIGDPYDTPDAPLIASAYDGAVASSDFYSDEWGTFLSGYAPIRGEDNVTVAVLGLDLDASTVIQAQDFIGSTIYLIMAISIGIAAIIIAYFGLTIIRDVRKLNKAAEDISKGDLEAQVDVNRKDEIGDLAESFSRMLASLKFEMMMRQESEQEKKDAGK
jgi:adenylate cyclase